MSGGGHDERQGPINEADLKGASAKSVAATVASTNGGVIEDGEINNVGPHGDEAGTMPFPWVKRVKRPPNIKLHLALGHSPQPNQLFTFKGNIHLNSNIYL